MKLHLLRQSLDQTTAHELSAEEQLQVKGGLRVLTERPAPYLSVRWDEIDIRLRNEDDDSSPKFRVG